jgi:hypothetical protein
MKRHQTNKRNRPKRQIVDLTYDQLDRLNADLPVVLKWIEATIPLAVREANSGHFEASHNACAMADNNKGITQKGMALVFLIRFLMKSSGVNGTSYYDAPMELGDGMALLGELGFLQTDEMAVQ